MAKVKVTMFDVSGFRRTAIIEGVTAEEFDSQVVTALELGETVLVDSEGTIFNLRNIVQINPAKLIEKGDE